MSHNTLSMFSRVTTDPSAPTLRRAWRLFNAFRVEQTDPDRFYGTLAADSVAQVGQFADVSGAVIGEGGYDTGGGGYVLLLSKWSLI